MDSDTVVTAVGDNKQQIMCWATAMAAPFTPYEADFKAQRTPLHNNYRSSPDLVRSRMSGQGPRCESFHAGLED